MAATQGEALQHARNQLVGELRASGMLGALIVLIFVVMVSTIVGTLAMAAMWHTLGRIEHVEVQTDAAIIDVKKAVERDRLVTEQNIIDINRRVQCRVPDASSSIPK